MHKTLFREKGRKEKGRKEGRKEEKKEGRGKGGRKIKSDAIILRTI